MLIPAVCWSLYRMLMPASCWILQNADACSMLEPVEDCSLPYAVAFSMLEYNTRICIMQSCMKLSLQYAYSASCTLNLENADSEKTWPALLSLWQESLQ